MQPIIDAHIHLDHYQEKEIEHIIFDDPFLHGLICVSYDLNSCKKNLALSKQFHKVRAAFGWHPEQEIIHDDDFNQLLSWICANQDQMIAIGEVGLPYYKLKDNPSLSIEGYVDVLQYFIQLASKWSKPIILHAIYEDAPKVCDMLEKLNIKKAHFHWFKGDEKTIQRMIANGYMISITPDVLYEVEIQRLVQQYPLQQMMVETDGPWPFKGPFQNKITHPSMMHQSMKAIADLKQMSLETVYQTLNKNTIEFYQFKNEGCS